MIEFKNVSKVYDKGSIAIQNATFTINNGDFVFLVGSSGSGKSTIIKMILKEKDPTTGKIYINGTDTTKLKRKQIPYLRRSMGVVFQDFRLIAEKTVYDNVAFAMYMIGANKKHIKRQVPMVLALVGIADKADKKPEELSGGEQQRVAIARALVNNPSVIAFKTQEYFLFTPTLIVLCFLSIVYSVNNTNLTISSSVSQP